MKKKPSEIIKETYKKVAEEVARGIRPKMVKTKMSSKIDEETIWDKEKLRHLISEVYSAHEEPHSGSAVIDQTTDFLDTLHKKALKAKGKEHKIIGYRKRAKEILDKEYGRQDESGLRADSSGYMAFEITVISLMLQIEKLLDSINGKKTK